MSAEAGAAAPTETAAPAAAPATPAPAPASEPSTPGEADAARVAAAVALLEEGNVPPVQEPEPAAEPPKVEAKPEPKTETPETPKESAAEAPKIPTLDELRAEVEARRQGRQRAPEPEPAKPQPPQQAPAAVSIERLRADPVGALIEQGFNPREILRAFAQHSMQAGQPQPQAGQKPTQPPQNPADIEAMIQARINEALQPFKEQQEAAAMAQQRDATFKAFTEITDDAAKYRYASRLSVDERIELGDQIADRFHEAGRNVNLELIAQTMEQHLKSLAERFAQGSAGPGTGNESAAGSEITTPAASPRSTTLTQSLPATPSPNKTPRTEEERVAAAIRVAQADG